jgi:hypothetical protein
LIPFLVDIACSSLANLTVIGYFFSLDYVDEAFIVYASIAVLNFLCLPLNLLTFKIIFVTYKKLVMAEAQFGIPKFTTKDPCFFNTNENVYGSPTKNFYGTARENDYGEVNSNSTYEMVRNEMKNVLMSKQKSIIEEDYYAELNTFGVSINPIEYDTPRSQELAEYETLTSPDSTGYETLPQRKSDDYDVPSVL